MHKKLLTAFLICAPMSAVANIPSTEYVQQQIASQIATAIANKANASDVEALNTKIGTLPSGYTTVGAALSAMVSTVASATQTMAGTYTVSGTLNLTGIAYAPTAELPPPPTDSELGGSTPSGSGSGGV